MTYVKGMRIVANDKAHPELVGKTGTVVEVNKDNIGVELDEMLYLHNCNGNCKVGHGWYFLLTEVEEEVSSPYCRTSERNKEITKTIRTNAKYGKYSIRQNGNIISVYKDDERIIVLAGRNLAMCKCTEEADAQYINHLAEAYKVNEELSMMNIDGKWLWTKYNPEEYKEKKIDEQQTGSSGSQTEPTAVGKAIHVQTEEELYRQLGITK